MNFDAAKDLLGPLGGQLALAFAAGCAAGYAFCVRTIHRMLQLHTEKEHERCMERIAALEKERDRVEERLKVVEDRWVSGTQRELAQLHISSVRVLGADKLGGPVE